MIFREVWLILSILVILYCDIANGLLELWFKSSSSTDSGLNINLEVKNNMFSSKIKIGSTKYQMILGTWFSGLWLFSKTACQSVEKQGDNRSKDMCKNARLYDDTKLKGKDKKPTFKIRHLEGEVQGYITKEAITIGNQELKNQDVGIVTDWDASIAENNRNGQFDGYFGITFIPMGTQNQVVGTSSFLAKNQYGIYLNSGRGEGELRLGGINSNYITGGEQSLKDVPVGEKGWLINIESFKVGSFEVGENLKAYVDPSTTLFQGKEDIITKINQNLGATNRDGNGFFFENCEIQNPPDIQLKINNEVYTLDWSKYTTKLTAVFFLNKCASNFGIHSSIEDYDLILGIPFLNKYYSVFDVENRRIRFAEAKRQN